MPKFFVLQTLDNEEQTQVVKNVAVADPDFANTQGWIPWQSDAEIGWIYDGVDFTPPPAPTQAEIDERLQKEVEAQLSSAVGQSNDRDKAIAFLMSDLWLYVQTGKTPNQATPQEIQTARNQVRSRLETHLRDIKGL